MTGIELRQLLRGIGLSQVAAAKAIGINPRTMRKYVAGDLKVPRVVELALRGLQP